MTTGPLRMLGAGLSCVLLAVAGAAACSRGVRPQSLCRAAYPDATLHAEYATTVGEIRARPAGPVGPGPAAGAWPRLADATAAAWCWLDDAEGPFVAAVTAGAPPVVFVRGNVPPDPDGPRLP